MKKISPSRLHKLITSQPSPLLAKELLHLYLSSPSSPPPHPSTLHTLALRLANSPHPSLALPILRHFASPSPPPPSLLSSLSLAFARAARPDLLFALLPHFSRSSPSLHSYNRLILAFARSNHLAYAIHLFNELPSLDLAPNATTYRILVQGLCRRGQVTAAEGLLNEMQHKGIPPDPFAYTTVLNSLCRKKKLREAYRLLCRMRPRGAQPDICHYNTVIVGFCREGRPLDACKVLDDMSEAGVSPDLVSYSTLVHGLCTCGLFGKAEGYLEEMVGRGLVPHFSVFHAVVKGFCVAGSVVEAARVLERMLCLGVPPHVETWDMVVRSVCTENSDDRLVPDDKQGKFQQLNMDQKLHKAVTRGNLELLKHVLQVDPKTLLTRTPQENTALHIAARLGHRQAAEIILNESDTILVEKNKDGDTPLHIASKFGRTEVAEFLINYSHAWPIDIDSEEGTPLTTRNKLGNTALHEAVACGKSDVALKLLEANPNMGHLLNERKESPLHIAARQGIAVVVKEILKQPWVPLEVETQPGVSGTGSPLHQAVIGGHIKILEMLLYHRRDLVKVVDADGNNALHYAAQNDKAKMVELLIQTDPSLAYASNNWAEYPLHVAVQYGSKSAVKEILKHCLDTAEQVEPEGGNALHLAVRTGKLGSLKCLLKHIQPEEIINYQDEEGNTPLHLAAKLSKIQSSLLLLKDKRVDPCLLNKKGQTARSVIETLETSTYEMYVWRELKKQEQKRCKNQQVPPAQSSRSFGRKKSTSDEYFELSVQTYTVVAALIATVTFSAMFTMPGGYNQNTGIAIMGKKSAFKSFVISNAIAMCSALAVVFCFIWACRDPVKFRLYKLKWGHRLTVVACLSMVVSLMTAVYLVVEQDSKWLSIVVILIGCSTPFVVLLILGHEVLFIPL